MNAMVRSMNMLTKIPCLAVLLHAPLVLSAAVHVVRTPDGGIQPQAAVDSKGTVHLIYYKGDPKGGDIFYVRRGSGATDFSKAIRVNFRPSTAMAIGTIRGAQVAVGRNGRAHVVWDGMGDGIRAFGPGAMEKHPLFYTRLNDAGISFEPERNVITYAYGLDGGSSVAADPKGNVYAVWHAPQPGITNGEAGRAVFVVRSRDEGKTFGREELATTEPTGACACCGLRAFADKAAAVYILYRGASTSGTRPETLLVSRNQGQDFTVVYQHDWKISSFPMSSASLSQSGEEVLAAAETHGRVFFVQADAKDAHTSSPVSPDSKAKYPVAIGNGRGEVLLVWAENTAWGRGGDVVWQVYDKKGEPMSEKGRREGLPAWSLPTAFASPDGSFTIVY
jgi:hypothetical protein